MTSAPPGQHDTTPPPVAPGPRRGTRPSATAAVLAAWAPPAAAATAMAALGVWGLSRDSAMGNDEVATRWAAQLSLRQLARLLSHVDAVHGLYYLLMHGWLAVGSSPAVLRIPSVIGMAAATGLTAVIARRLTGSGFAALFAGLIMALTPTITFYAQTARSYALVLGCVLGATLALLRAMTAEADGGPGSRIARGWVLYAALVTLSGYLNELALLVLAAHAVTVALARCGRRTLARWAAAGAGGAVLVVPLAVLSAREDGAVAWIPRPGLWSLRILFHDYFGATTLVAVLLAGCAVVAVLPPRQRWRWWPGGVRAPSGPAPSGSAPSGSAAPAAWWSSGGVSLPSVAAPLVVVPAALLILESLVARPLYVDRYVLYGEAGAALLAGAGAWRIGWWLGAGADRRALVWLPGVIVCLAALLLQLGPQQRVRTPASRLFDFGGPSRYVAAHARPGDGVLFFSAFFRKAELGYPADFRKTSDFALAVPPARAGTYQGINKPAGVTCRLMLARRRIWVVGRPPSARPAAGAYREESIVLRQHFSLLAQRRFRGIVVTLWLRR